MKSFYDRYKDEILTDNTKIKTCEQCKTCKWWNNGDVWSNSPEKCSCVMFPHPDFKPTGIIYGREECLFYDNENGDSEEDEDEEEEE